MSYPIRLNNDFAKKKRRKKVKVKEPVGLRILDDDIEVPPSTDDISLSNTKDTVITSKKLEIQKNRKDKTSHRSSRLDSDDEDQSPPRRKRMDSDNEEDQSPPRRKHEETISIRKQIERDDDQSPPRRRRMDSDDEDLSPPRRRRMDSDDEDQSPPRRRRLDSDDDQSPPRRRKMDSDDDQSPPRRRRVDSDEDLSPPRKRRRLDRDEEDTNSISPKKSSREDKMSLDRSSDKSDSDFMKIGRREGAPRKKPIKLRDHDKEKQDEEDWVKGSVQKQKEIDMKMQFLEAMKKPFSRTKDDKELETDLKSQDRFGDPMAQYLKSKKKSKQKEKPSYNGPPAPPNRFNIAPGFRWDGVDRSSGFEKYWFNTQAKRKTTNDAAYKWSTEDM